MKWGLEWHRSGRIYFGLLLCLLPVLAHAGGVDSLMSVLNGSKGKQRADILNALSQEMLSDDSDRARNYANIALRLSDSLSYVDGQADAHYNLGFIAWNHADHDLSIDEFSQALDYYTTAKDSVGMQEAYNGLGLNYDSKGKSEKALRHYTDALAINEKIRHNKGLSATYNNIGMMYYSQGDYPMANEYFLRCLSLDSLQGDTVGMGFTHSNIGMIYSKMEQHEKAIQHLQSSLELRRRQNSPALMARALNNLGSAYEAAGRMEDAEKVFVEALEIKRSLNVDNEVAITLNNIGAFYLGWEKPNIAYPYLIEAHSIFDTLSPNDYTIDNLNHLSLFHAQRGEYEDAYKYKSSASQLSDSLLNEKMLNERNELLARYDNEVKERQLEQLQLDLANDKLKASRRNLLLAILATVAFLVMAIALVALIGYRRKVRSNQELRRLNDDVASKNREIEAQRDLLEQQNAKIKGINTTLELLVQERTANLLAANRELDTFLYESSHALRRPLLRIVALFDLMRQEKDPATVEELNHKVEVTVRAMNNTFRKLVEVNEITRRVPQPDSVRLSELVSSVLRELGDAYRPADMEVITDSSNGDTFTADRWIFTAIFRNILDNALHFHRIAQGVPLKVRIHLAHDSKGLILTVQDNGMGIPARLHEDIFQMFFRGTEMSNGSGLGLFVVKKGVEKLHGTVEVKSTEGQGTEMVVRIPYPEKET